MASDTLQPLDDDESPPTAAELDDADFQIGLKALVAAYQGMLSRTSSARTTRRR
jgi:hypothetical protein